MEVKQPPPPLSKAILNDHHMESPPSNLSSVHHTHTHIYIAIFNTEMQFMNAQYLTLKCSSMNVQTTIVTMSMCQAINTIQQSCSAVNTQSVRNWEKENRLICLMMFLIDNSFSILRCINTFRSSRPVEATFLQGGSHRSAMRSPVRHDCHLCDPGCVRHFGLIPLYFFFLPKVFSRSNTDFLTPMKLTNVILESLWSCTPNEESEFNINLAQNHGFQPSRWRLPSFKTAIPSFVRIPLGGYNCLVPVLSARRLYVTAHK